MLLLVDESGLKGLSCVLRKDVLCSYRKVETSGFMDRCFSCREYSRFMREMDAQDEAEDAAFLAEFERENKFAKCSFEDCLCDGEHGKLACFGTNLDSSEVWTCRRFDVEKLSPDGIMRQEYLSALNGGWSKSR